MGTSDLQLKTHIRSLVAHLQKALEAQDWTLIKELQEELKKTLED